jgi:hypothetical protein
MTHIQTIHMNFSYTQTIQTSEDKIVEAESSEFSDRKDTQTSEDISVKQEFQK